MSKLLITEITRMGPAFCVIGLQHHNDKLQSVRPITSTAKSWSYFPHKRGDVLECDLAALPAQQPHIEDRVATRNFTKSATVPQPEMTGYLRRAEFASSLPELFGCRIHENKNGSGLYAIPREATRSICGCSTSNLRLELCGKLRATLALPSGEVLRDLPVVDRDWCNFIDNALSPARGANRGARLERFLNSAFHYKIIACPHHFIRLGLTRPYSGLCWLMLDTLLPLPQQEWLEEI